MNTKMCSIIENVLDNTEQRYDIEQRAGSVRYIFYRDDRRIGFFTVNEDGVTATLETPRPRRMVNARDMSIPANNDWRTLSNLVIVFKNHYRAADGQNVKKRNRKLTITTLTACKEAMGIWLDKGKPIRIAAETAGTSPQRMRKYMPEILELTGQEDPEKRKKWEGLLKTLGELAP